MDRGDRSRHDRDPLVVGAPDPFEAFYRREVQSVLAVTMALTKRRWEAEEATQEAFLRAYRDWDRVGRMNHPGAWVRRVAVNEAVSRFRRTGAEIRAILRLTPRHSPPPSDPVSDRFWDEVRRLPARQAQVVALTYVDDLDAEEIGRILGITSSTVRVHLSRARITLAERLETEL